MSGYEGGPDACLDWGRQRCRWRDKRVHIENVTLRSAENHSRSERDCMKGELTEENSTIWFRAGTETFSAPYFTVMHCIACFARRILRNSDARLSGRTCPKIWKSASTSSSSLCPPHLPVQTCLSSRLSAAITPTLPPSAPSASTVRLLSFPAWAAWSLLLDALRAPLTLTLRTLDNRSPCLRDYASVHVRWRAQQSASYGAGIESRHD